MQGSLTHSSMYLHNRTNEYCLYSRRGEHTRARTCAFWNEGGARICVIMYLHTYPGLRAGNAGQEVVLGPAGAEGTSPRGTSVRHVHTRLMTRKGRLRS